MRGIKLLLLAGMLGSCSTAPQPTMRSAEGQREYERLIAGKVAGPPVTCLPSYNSNDMIVIDERTIAYRAGGARTFINHMRGDCDGLGRSTALVTRSFGSGETCSGDVAQVADLTSRTVVGSCLFGEFIPYTKPPVR
jgi:hypothetical protein